MAMSLYNDYPSADSRARRNIPLMYNLMDFVEKELDQNVGRILRNLPEFLQPSSNLMQSSPTLLSTSSCLNDDYLGVPNRKKRKIQHSPDNVFGRQKSDKKAKVSALAVGKDGKYTITLDCSQFDPANISVRIVEDKMHITAKHEFVDESGSEVFEINKLFDLPENFDSENVTSQYSSSKQLIVEVPIKQTTIGKIIKIQVEPSLKCTDSPMEEADSAKDTPVTENGQPSKSS